MKYRRPQPKRFAARSRALRVSSSRFLGGALIVSESISRRAIVVTSATALLNAASFACEGCVVPLSLRTNCNAEARISSSVAGGAKFASVLMFLHMSAPRDARLNRATTMTLEYVDFLESRSSLGWKQDETSRT